MGYEKYAAPIDEGDIILKFAQIMKAAKYKADMCLENEIVGRLKTPRALWELKREIDYLARDVHLICWIEPEGFGEKLLR